jgi:hypothetical protein
MGICSHSVAVAQLNNLQQFVNAFSKVKRKPDFTSLAVHSMPSGRGRKGGQAPRARKKAPEPATTRVERLTPSVASAAARSPSVGEMNNSTMLNVTANYPHSSSLYCQPSYQSSSYPGPSWVNPYFPECYSGVPYNCMSPLASQQPSQSSTPAMAEEQSPFNLCFITGNISKCAGCGNKYACMQNQLFPLMTYAYTTVSGVLLLHLVEVHNNQNLPPRTIMSTCHVFAGIGLTSSRGSW